MHLFSQCLCYIPGTNLGIRNANMKKTDQGLSPERYKTKKETKRCQIMRSAMKKNQMTCGIRVEAVMRVMRFTGKPSLMM